MNLFGPVERNTHQKSVGRKKFGPCLVDQHPVGLQRVFDMLAAGIPPLQSDRLAVKIEPQQQRLPAMPAKLHGRHLVGLDVLTDIEFQKFVAHDGLTAAVLRRLVEIITIAAIEVAG